MASVSGSEEPRNEPEAGSVRDESPMFVEQESDQESDRETPDGDTPGRETPDEEPNSIPGQDQQGGAKEEGDRQETNGDDDGDGDGDGKDNEADTDPDSDSDSDSDSDPYPPCPACGGRSQYLQRLQVRLKNRKNELRVERAENRRLDAENKELKAQLEAKKAKRNGQPGNQPHTWPTLLHEYLAGNHGVTYASVLKVCNKESAICVDPRQVHPNVRLVSADEVSESGDALQPNTPFDEALKFEWSALPLNVQFRIFRFLLEMEGSLVHVFSRLDPFAEMADLDPQQSTLPRKFFISKVAHDQDPLSLSTNAVSPATLLRPLLTCKRWCFYLCHIFYGENTFAFSSFSEFARFSKGIGARIQRVKNLEIYCWLSLWSTKRVPSDMTNERNKHREGRAAIEPI